MNENITLVLTKSDLALIVAKMKTDKSAAIVLRGSVDTKTFGADKPAAMRDVWFLDADCNRFQVT